MWYFICYRDSNSDTSTLDTVRIEPPFHSVNSVCCDEDGKLYTSSSLCIKRSDSVEFKDAFQHG